MEFLKSIAKGFGWGLGFTAAVLLVAVFVAPHVPTEQGRELRKVINNSLKAEELELIPIIEKKLTVKDGRIAIVGTLRNDNNFSIRQVQIGATILESGTPIEKCGGQADTSLSPSSVVSFVVLCEKQWSEISLKTVEAKLAVSYGWPDEDV